MFAACKSAVGGASAVRSSLTPPGRLRLQLAPFLSYFIFLNNTLEPCEDGRIVCGGCAHLCDGGASQIGLHFVPQTEANCADGRTRREWIQVHSHRNLGCGSIFCPLPHLIVPKALQGAFVEHQVMLQKLSLQAEISVNLVRSVQDLQTCDALVIPGGGMPHLALALSRAQLLFCRVYNDCSPSETLWPPRPTTGVLEDQTRLGLVRWGNSHVSQCREYQEGWPGPPRRPVRHHRQKWMGISGGATRSVLYSRHLRWFIQVESFEAPLVVQLLSQPDRSFHGVFIRAPVLPPFCSLSP